MILAKEEDLSSAIIGLLHSTKNEPGVSKSRLPSERFPSEPFVADLSNVSRDKDLSFFFWLWRDVDISGELVEFSPVFGCVSSSGGVFSMPPRGNKGRRGPSDIPENVFRKPGLMAGLDVSEVRHFRKPGPVPALDFLAFPREPREILSLPGAGSLLRFRLPTSFGFLVLLVELPRSSAPVVLHRWTPVFGFRGLPISASLAGVDALIRLREDNVLLDIRGVASRSS